MVGFSDLVEKTKNAASSAGSYASDHKFFVALSTGLCLTYVIFVLGFSFFWVEFSWGFLNRTALGFCGTFLAAAFVRVIMDVKGVDSSKGGTPEFFALMLGGFGVAVVFSTLSLIFRQ